MHEHHTHGGGGDLTVEEALAMLRFSLEHNESHLEELLRLADALDALGAAAASAETRQAAEAYRQGNRRLEQALARVREG